MNEEQLANALAEQLDALLAGDSPASAPPAEVSDLLDLSEELGGLTPAPRPEFAAALKASVLASQGAAATAGGATAGISPWVISGLVLAVITAGAVLVTVLLFSRNQVETPATPEPTSLPAIKTEATVPPSPAATDALPTPETPEPAATQTSRAADSLPTAAATVAPTALLDVLPPITITVEIETPDSGVEVSPPGGLVPGQSGSGGDDGSRGSNHGEDDDDHHHDDD